MHLPKVLPPKCGCIDIYMKSMCWQIKAQYSFGTWCVDFLWKEMEERLCLLRLITLEDLYLPFQGMPYSVCFQKKVQYSRQFLWVGLTEKHVLQAPSLTRTLGSSGHFGMFSVQAFTTLPPILKCKTKHLAPVLSHATLNCIPIHYRQASRIKWW